MNHRVAEAVGEEQFRHRMDYVVLSEAEYVSAVARGGERQRGMHMHRSFRRSGRTRSVKPEAHLVADGRRGVLGCSCRLQSVLEECVREVLGARHEDVFEMWKRIDQI